MNNTNINLLKNWKERIDEQTYNIRVNKIKQKKYHKFD